MADSRVADDFRLELRTSPPAQLEEDALRDFVRWLQGNVQIVESASPSTGNVVAWLDAMRRAARETLDASPPVAPPDPFDGSGEMMLDLSPPGITVSRDQFGELLQSALRFWVTELRPERMARRCHRAKHRDDEDCVLLARVELEVLWAGGSPTGAWQVAGGADIVVVDESTRPVVAQLRLLQEFMAAELTGGSLASGGPAVPSPRIPVRPGPVVVRPGSVLPGPGTPGPVMPLTRPVPASPASPSRLPLVETTSDLTLDETHCYVRCSGAGDVAITLPAADAATRGQVYIIKSVDASVTIIPHPGNDIDGDVGDRALRTRRTMTLVSDGAGHWDIIARVA